MAAPLVQEEVVDTHRDKPFQMLGVDLWNGSPAQVNTFTFVTQVKFPMLQKGRNPEFPWGLGIDNVIIVDQDGIVRGWHSEEDIKQINALIDLVLTPAPVSELKPKSLYYGRTAEVGVELKIKVTVENTGLRDLEVRSIRSSTDQVVVDRTSFVVEPGGSETFTITLSPTRAGTITGSVEVVTNEKNWSLPIPSIVIEAPLPAISLPKVSLDFGAVEIGRPSSQTIEIRNDGLGPLKVTQVGCELSELSFSDQAFTLNAGETKTITITVFSLAEGPFSGVVNILSDDPVNGSLNVSISGSARIVPADGRADFDGSGSVDFADFLGFSGAFGTPDASYDINQSGLVDFSDFLIFVENFGRPVL